MTGTQATWITMTGTHDTWITMTGTQDTWIQMTGTHTWIKNDWNTRYLDQK